ncbi:hypothetical protein GCM10010840_29300 [Deinococcus aerolatus]|uniref:Acetyltransferase n=1 Tax=Deinococcus aerolatus TaxID=522487 RepID=A0ABQ2GDK6_9DEIO|nr:hypothetical protein [Deinococcus aerolatus]GGL89325.1 hypothetical protein GCM10010840_29300 [Deinococcus aerolatus]
MNAMLERYVHVRQMVLLTSDGPEQAAFYRSLGFANVRDVPELNALYRTNMQSGD